MFQLFAQCYVMPIMEIMVMYILINFKMAKGKVLFYYFILFFKVVIYIVTRLCLRD
jgi:hypothetical protein